MLGILTAVEKLQSIKQMNNALSWNFIVLQINSGHIFVAKSFFHALSNRPRDTVKTAALQTNHDKTSGI